MTDTSARMVVAGVDGTAAGHHGVRYAAIEAQHLGASLSLVHVSPASTLSADSSTPVDLLRDYGLELLEGALNEARTVAPEVEVETRLVSGMTTVHGLANASDEATVLVLGDDRHSFAGRVWTGDVVAGVAARAACPVVVVPPEWEAREEHGRIIVGVKDPEHAAELVTVGLTLAADRGAELVVLHAWKAPSGYDDIIATRTFAHEHGRRQQALIDPVVDSLRAERPEVDVRVEILHAQPAHALVHASETADHLIISRPRRGGTVHHLGGVGRALLRESRCPVQVEPSEARRSRPPRPVEEKP